MGAILDADPERDLATFLTSLPEWLTFGDEDPATIVDRYYSPDFEQYNDGIRLDRDRLIQHAKPARKNVVSIRTDVHDVLISGDRFAARYTIGATMRKGATLVNEVYMLGRFAPDGRIRRIDSTTRAIPSD
ncbi:MAG TPA: nuclear transport factor 2 family protein [Pilimelia sp.]|nr:nuclear transport factor 2 family protein [Pilimelia sp.]